MARACRTAAEIEDNMNKVKLLDCTLRDGGFVNDWNFGRQSIINIFSRLAASKIDYIELGFINESYPFDINRTNMPHTRYLKDIYDAKIKTNAKLLAMVIIGEASIEAIGERNDTVIDAIRVVFKKSNIDKGFEFAEQCRAKGYEVYLQPASVTDYSNEEMLALVEKANRFKPRALYIVDTYGLLKKREMFRYAKLIDENLDTCIAIGYHSHNNFQLSYATAMEFIECGLNHELIIDCTLYGMGKTTGNLNTELIIDYMNKTYNTDYDNFQILEAIDSEILKIRQNFEWGYSLNGFIAASNNCHPKYVSYLLKKRSLSVGSINKILSRIDSDKLTTFDRQLIDKLFIEYQSNYVDDSCAVKALADKLKGRNILIMASGKTIDTEREIINKYIAERNPLIIGVNYVPNGYKLDYCFINNSKRFTQMSLFVNYDYDAEIIATSNIVSAAREIEYTVNYASALVEGDIEIIADNATLMLFKLLRRCGINKIAVAGFDGFASDGSNYADKYLSFNKNTDWDEQNALIGDKLAEFGETMDIELITSSHYVK